MSVVTKESNPKLYNALFEEDEIKEILDKITDEDWYEEKDLTGTKWIELKQEETNLLYDYITNLQRQIEIMERYLELICDLGYDYDGYNKSEDLKGLIDELVHYASLGRACNDKEAIFEDGEGMKVNILDEIILKKVENE